MSDQDKSKEQLITELQALRAEKAKWENIQTAFGIHDQLYKSLLTMGKTTTGLLMLKSILIEIVKISSKLTGAEECSVFLLNANGSVSESLLARGAMVREQKNNLIGNVLGEGLAGWVYREREIGLVMDTKNDDRWLNLPNQPFFVRSALCFPVIKGKFVNAVITMMHSQPEHFSQKDVDLLKLLNNTFGLVVDYAESLHHKLAATTPTSIPETPQVPVVASMENHDQGFQVGLYMLGEDGNFLYANRKLAEIFGYQFSELVSLDSIYSLALASNQNAFKNHINNCLQRQSPQLACRLQAQRKDGTLIDVALFGSRTKFYGKPVIIGALKPV
jgi:PAS domain S-box-containing protein